jgi:hypothetical protein
MLLAVLIDIEEDPSLLNKTTLIEYIMKEINLIMLLSILIM